MSSTKDITYSLDVSVGKGRRKLRAGSSPLLSREGQGIAIPRIARLMALALRFDGLLRAEQFRDYSELAHLGRVTRARMTQIMKLLDLAPDIQ